MLADAASLASFGTGLGLATASHAHSDNTVPEGLLVVGMLGYVTAAPTLHLLHARSGMAAASAGLRLGTPPLVALLTLATPVCGQTTVEHCVNGVALAATGGMVLASILDASLFAYEPALPRAAASRFGVTPVISAAGTRAELFAYGTF